MKTVSTLTVNPRGAFLDGVQIASGDLTALDRQYAGDYPKFFKMDMLSRLGFVAAEILLRDIPLEDKENAAVILFNRSGSLVTDRNYQLTLADGNYFPSPALFVYTLANIVTGEIAIRHKIFGETSFHILEKEDPAEMDAIVESAWTTSNPPFILTGWVEYADPDNYEANFKIVTNN